MQHMKDAINSCWTSLTWIWALDMLLSSVNIREEAIMRDLLMKHLIVWVHRIFQTTLQKSCRGNDCVFKCAESRPTLKNTSYEEKGSINKVPFTCKRIFPWCHCHTLSTVRRVWSSAKLANAGSAWRWTHQASLAWTLVKWLLSPS